MAAGASVLLHRSGAFGKTWRKGKAKAAAEIARLISLQEQVSHIARHTPSLLLLFPAHALLRRFVDAQGQLPATVGSGDVATRTLEAWVEPAGPKPLTVMELSEDLDNMAKSASAISKAAEKKPGASPSSKKSSGKKKMLQVDEVMALVIGSLLASQ
eukprot:COSAG02_NODE_565_length_20246_cov_13.930163_3_plen_157_part_00